MLALLSTKKLVSDAVQELWADHGVAINLDAKAWRAADIFDQYTARLRVWVERMVQFPFAFTPSQKLIEYRELDLVPGLVNTAPMATWDGVLKQTEPHSWFYVAYQGAATGTVASTQPGIRIPNYFGIRLAFRLALEDQITRLPTGTIPHRNLTYLRLGAQYSWARFIGKRLGLAGSLILIGNTGSLQEQLAKLTGIRDKIDLQLDSTSTPETYLRRVQPPPISWATSYLVAINLIPPTSMGLL